MGFFLSLIGGSGSRDVIHPAQVSPSALTYDIVGHQGGESYEAIRQLGGKIYSSLPARMAMGMIPRGSADHRTPRDQSLAEIHWWINSAMDRIDNDVGMAQAQSQYRYTVIQHILVQQERNQNLAYLIAQGIDLVAQGKDVSKIEEQIARVPMLPPPPDSPPLNRMTDVEYAYVVADLEAIYMRTRGYPRQGSPYRRRWEVAWEELCISAGWLPSGAPALSTGNEDPEQGRFQERRADINRDNILDTMVLRTVNRRMANPYFTLRDGVNSVRSDLFAHASAEYEQWLGYIRGMIAERDKLLEFHGKPENNPFGVTIPKGRAYEVLVRHLAGEKFASPGGPNFGEVMERVRKEFGDHPAPRDAVLRHIVIHGRPERERGGWGQER